ncbi:MAG: MarR family transcriptional regulator [bacterium]|nr:MarR family transcriptional regulator [bacterium]
MQKHSDIKGSFIGSIFYEIDLTAKYCKMLGTQVFEKFETDVSVEEFAVLDTLLCNPGICQRDLAKIILKDRANTGKIIDNLEKKGLVKRILSIKNNRPVKLTELTEDGIKKAEEVSKNVRPHLALIQEKVIGTDIGQVSELLKKFRQVLSESVDIQI